MNDEQEMIRRLHELLTSGKWDELRQAFGRLDPADLADFMEELPAVDRDRLFRLLDLETASDVLVELDSGLIDKVVEALPSEHIADLAEQMAPDEAADFLGELDAEQSERVLAAMELPEQTEVRQLLVYPDESAGGIMTPEVLALPPTETVAATRKILAGTDLSDPVLNVYVVAPEDFRLIGLVRLPELLAAEPETPLEDIADCDMVSCFPDEDQEEVARKFRKYDLWVMPVVDASGRLLGRITADDVMDVIREEADEDLAHMAGAPDLEEREESLFRITRMRLPWLMITMIAGLLNSMIIKLMMNTTSIETIAIFVPAILAMGGNTGMQSSAICIRGIALGEKKYARLFAIVRREIRVGITLGILCGTMTALIVFAALSIANTRMSGLAPSVLACTVGLAMCNAMAFAGTFGAVVPVILHRLHVDPALASGPFVTTSNDLSASMIYFLTCLLLLRVA